MGRDIWLRWKGQTEAEQQAQRPYNQGASGYLRSLYHNEVKMSVLRRLVRDGKYFPRRNELYNNLLALLKTNEWKKCRCKRNIRAFVDLCEMKIIQLGEKKVWIVSW
ncbi:hypothetical protein MUP79_10220 [Candidatus Bathyarchaeota archaeon]|nr:hypothetical protein [Candidatus Bathyarchaeota archaeon]